MKTYYASTTVPEMETTGTRGLLLEFLRERDLDHNFDYVYDKEFRRAELICSNGHYFGLNLFPCDNCGSSSVNRVFKITEDWKDGKYVKVVGNPSLLCGETHQQEYRDRLLRKWKYLTEKTFSELEQQLIEIRRKTLDPLKEAEAGLLAEISYPALPRTPGYKAMIESKSKQVQYVRSKFGYDVSKALDLVTETNEIGCNKRWGKTEEFGKLCSEDRYPLEWGWIGSEITDFQKFNILFALDAVFQETKCAAKPSVLDSMLFIRSSSQDLGVLRKGIVKEGRRVKSVRESSGAYSISNSGNEYLKEKLEKFKWRRINEDALREFYIGRFKKIPQDKIKGRNNKRIWIPEKTVEELWRESHVEVHGYPAEYFTGV